MNALRFLICLKGHLWRFNRYDGVHGLSPHPVPTLQRTVFFNEGPLVDPSNLLLALSSILATHGPDLIMVPHSTTH